MTGLQVRSDENSMFPAAGSRVPVGLSATRALPVLFPLSRVRRQLDLAGFEDVLDLIEPLSALPAAQTYCIEHAMHVRRQA